MKVIYRDDLDAIQRAFAHARETRSRFFCRAVLPEGRSFAMAGAYRTTGMRSRWFDIAYPRHRARHHRSQGIRGARAADYSGSAGCHRKVPRCVRTDPGVCWHHESRWLGSRRESTLPGCMRVSGRRSGRPAFLADWVVAGIKGCAGKDSERDQQSGARRSVSGGAHISLGGRTERLVDFALHPILDNKGRILFLHPTGIDITDLKRAEENYRSLAETLEAQVRRGRTSWKSGMSRY